MMTKEHYFAEIVKQRRSTRGFLSTPVSTDTLRSVFTLAGLAPSNCNTQPWVVHVVSGKSCESLRQRLSQAFIAGEFDIDIPYDGQYSGVYKERQYEAARELYCAMAITREDKLARDAAFLKNFQFFDAPHAVFLFLEPNFGLREACDVGMYAQTLMLAMTAKGLASCAQTALSFNAGIVKDALSINNDLKLMFGISFGYRDESVLANAANTKRASLEECVTFHE